MRLIDTIPVMKSFIRLQKQTGKTIGLVPTMGSLHEGHLSLVKASKRDNDITVMSIFVNPAQFGKNEDFSRYPRNLEKDMQMAQEEGVDIIFVPSESEIYPRGFKTYVNVEGITEILCGRFRPGHFKGVTTIVSKLLNITEPDRAYFGHKDAQQAAVIRQMVIDLNMNTEIVVCPIVREKDGLALSSRNVYLDKNERKAAVILSKTLSEAEDIIKSGERDREKLISYINTRISAEKHARVEYIEIVDANSLEEIQKLEGSILIAIAVWIGKTRLIDNIIAKI